MDLEWRGITPNRRTVHDVTGRAVFEVVLERTGTDQAWRWMVRMLPGKQVIGYEDGRGQDGFEKFQDAARALQDHCAGMAG